MATKIVMESSPMGGFQAEVEHENRREHYKAPTLPGLFQTVWDNLKDRGALPLPPAQEEPADERVEETVHYDGDEPPAPPIQDEERRSVPRVAPVVDPNLGEE